MKRWGMMVWSMICVSLYAHAKNVPSQDVELRIGDGVRFGNVDATVVRFGGYTTPECKLAISNDGQYFFFKKVGSTCKTLTNSKGVKIVCNANKSVCKTRDEMVRAVKGRQDTRAPSWCNSSHLNKTEHTICADETLGALDRELAKVYGAAKAHRNDGKQSAWIKRRNRCGNDAACIKKAYEERINELRDVRESVPNDTISQDSDFSVLSLRKSWCENGDAASCVSVGVMYDEGKEGTPIDDYKATTYYKRGCKLGSARGCAYAGLMYANGEGVSRDLNTALNYLEKGCAKGEQKACENANAVRNDLRNKFRGVKKNACYSIRQYGPQKVCLEGTGGSACYGLEDYGLQRVCKEGAGGSACYGLKDYGMQRVCKEGIRSDACYALKDYTMQRSCRNFKGSTTFWLILAHYGYYVN